MSASEPRRGAYLERNVQAHLRTNGYWTMRAPGSKGPVDVVAIKPGQVLMVQVKLAGLMPPAERHALWDAAHAAGAVPVLVRREKPGVLVWARLVARDGPPLAVWREFVIDEVGACGGQNGPGPGTEPPPGRNVTTGKGRNHAQHV